MLSQLLHNVKAFKSQPLIKPIVIKTFNLLIQFPTIRKRNVCKQPRV